MSLGGKGSLEDTPTWAVSLLCLAIFLLSVIIDTSLHHLTEFLRRKKRKSLNKALNKIKTEMMIMGFISLLLTIFEVPISKICVSEAVANSFLPCKDPPLESSSKPAISSATQKTNSSSNSNTTVSPHLTDELKCEAKGMVSLLSKEGIDQLHIFIVVLAVFHVLYCVLTMFLGSTKMRRWKAWEEETQTLQYQIMNDPRRFRLARQTSFGRRHLKFWTDYPLLLWPGKHGSNFKDKRLLVKGTNPKKQYTSFILVCFIRQFRGSVSKADYFTLRNGFIKANFAEGSNFNFQKFLARAFDEDFEQVVGISFWIWIFSIFFIFFSAHDFYNYYWLPFIPLVIALVVGMKLEVIISKMCLESFNTNSVVRGTFSVIPNDDFFWLGRPKWLLHLLQFILIQNSFQLAFFTWTWYEYGIRSCFNRETDDIAIRISMGVSAQFLCGYVTLPLYALVTQMGSGMRKAVFTERVVTGLKHWQDLARSNLSKNKSMSSKHSSGSWTIDTTETSISDMQNTILPKCEHLLPSAVMSTPCSLKIYKDEEVKHKNISNPDEASSSNPEINEEASPKIIARETTTYDGEISFGSSWKEVGSGKGISTIASIIEEDASKFND